MKHKIKCDCCDNQLGNEDKKYEVIIDLYKEVGKGSGFEMTVCDSCVNKYKLLDIIRLVKVKRDVNQAREDYGKQ